MIIYVGIRFKTNVYDFVYCFVTLQKAMQNKTDVVQLLFSQVEGFFNTCVLV